MVTSKGDLFYFVFEPYTSLNIDFRFRSFELRNREIDFDQWPLICIYIDTTFEAIFVQFRSKVVIASSHKIDRLLHYLLSVCSNIESLISKLE